MVNEAVFSFFEQKYFIDAIHIICFPLFFGFGLYKCIDYNIGFPKQLIAREHSQFTHETYVEHKLLTSLI